MEEGEGMQTAHHDHMVLLLRKNQLVYGMQYQYDRVIVLYYKGLLFV